jgi:hypothetical protein
MEKTERPVEEEEVAAGRRNHEVVVVDPYQEDVELCYPPISPVKWQVRHDYYCKGQDTSK